MFFILLFFYDVFCRNYKFGKNSRNRHLCFFEVWKIHWIYYFVINHTFKRRICGLFSRSAWCAMIIWINFLHVLIFWWTNKSSIRQVHPGFAAWYHALITATHNANKLVESMSEWVFSKNGRKKKKMFRMWTKKTIKLKTEIEDYENTLNDNTKLSKAIEQGLVLYESGPFPAIPWLLHPFPRHFFPTVQRSGNFWLNLTRIHVSGTKFLFITFSRKCI